MKGHAKLGENGGRRGQMEEYCGENRTDQVTWTRLAKDQGKVIIYTTNTMFLCKLLAAFNDTLVERIVSSAFREENHPKLKHPNPVTNCSLIENIELLSLPGYCFNINII